MVDFQSRDTSRSVDEDEQTDAEESESDAAGVAHPNESTAAAQAGDTEPTVAESDHEQVAVAILVTDDEADATDDVAAALATEHEVLGRDERTGDLDSIQTAVNTFLDQPSVDAVVTVGGVGVGPTQVTVDAVTPLLDSELPGFGEQFRRRYEEVVDSAAIRTRAFAGIAGTTPVFCLPGDGEAARAATEDLVVPELDWLVSAASSG